MTTNKKFRSISIKLVFMLSFSVLIAVSMTSAVLFWYKYNQSKEQAVETLSQTVAIMGENLTASLVFDDSESAKTILAALKLSDDVDGAYILKDGKAVFASYVKKGIDESGLKNKFESIRKANDLAKEVRFIDFDNIVVAKPIYSEKKYIASFVIISNTDMIKKILRTQLFMQFGTSAVVLLIVILLAFKLQKIFTLPIFRLKAAMDDVREHGNLDAKIDFKSNDEFQSLFDGFYLMIETIKEQRHQLEHHAETLNETIKLKTADIEKQKRELEALLATVDKNVIISRTNLAGTITQASEAFCKISGFARDELIGKKHNIMRHPDMPRTIFGELWSTIQSGKIWRGEIKNRKKDGGFYWVSAVITPELDEDGKLAGYNAIREDITAKKEVEEAKAELIIYQEHLESLVDERTNELNEEKNFVNTVMNSQNNFVISTNGIVLKTANRALFDFFKIKSVEEFLSNYGNCICDTFCTDSPEGFLRKMMDGQKWTEFVCDNPSKMHKAMIEKEGKRHIFAVTADSFVFKDEKLSVAVFNDITELEKIREEVEKILENILLPVLITSQKERKILYANKYAELQYERPISELVGSDIDEIYTKNDQHKHILDAMDEHGKVENLEEVFQTASGKEFTALLSVTPIFYNNTDAYIGMVTDITKQKNIENEVRVLHKHTRESIEYASLIQHSLIPSSDDIRAHFAEYFVIWHPKDIVGGDIYFFEALNDKNECILFVVDCTGHGVPGAFVTMLVKAIERQINANIRLKNEEVQPAKLLEVFNKNMKSLLRQERADAISNAGFDGAIIYHNKETGVLKFAGAQTPLFYVEDGELKIIKGDKQSIGYKKSDADFKFTEHVIEAKKGMCFYVATDGYLDQNGGEKGFPFGKKKFCSLIEQYHMESFADQQEIFLEELYSYQKDEIRNDDITLIGFRI